MAIELYIGKCFTMEYHLCEEMQIACFGMSGQARDEGQVLNNGIVSKLPINNLFQFLEKV